VRERKKERERGRERKKVNERNKIPIEDDVIYKLVIIRKATVLL